MALPIDDGDMMDAEPIVVSDNMGDMMNEGDAKQTTAKAVYVALADSYTTQFRAHGYHWNVKGPDFTEMHQFFGMVYEDIDGATDDYSEIIRRLGFDAPDKLSQIVDATNIDDVDVSSDPLDMIKALYDANDTCITSILTAYEAASAANEQGICNFLAGRDDMHKKWRWQMNAMMGNN